MSTRSHIAVQRIAEPKTIDYIYCHYDGYPEHHGPILTNHYNTIEKVNELMELGDLCSLGEEIGEKHDMDKKPISVNNEKWCSAFGRDRGEYDVMAKTDLMHNVISDTSVDYLYLFNEYANKWYCFEFNTKMIDLNEFVNK